MTRSTGTNSGRCSAGLGDQHRARKLGSFERISNSALPGLDFFPLDQDAPVNWDHEDLFARIAHQRSRFWCPVEPVDTEVWPLKQSKMALVRKSATQSAHLPLDSRHLDRLIKLQFARSAVIV